MHQNIMATPSRRAPRPMPSNFQRFAVNRSRLPNPLEFFAGEGIELAGMGRWRNGLCPFHMDTRPSLRVCAESGAFRCMACGAHGGDVLAFQMLRHRLKFVDAAKALGAWEVMP